MARSIGSISPTSLARSIGQVSSFLPRQIGGVVPMLAGRVSSIADMVKKAADAAAGKA